MPRGVRLVAVVLGSSLLPAVSASPAGAQDGGVRDGGVHGGVERCTTAVDPGTVAREREDVTALASDGMEGRAPGTPGGIAAAEYIVHALATLGVTPAGTDGYRQAFPVEYGREVTAGTTVLLRRGVDTVQLERGVDYVLEAAGADSRSTLPVTSVGHGIDGASWGWDELHGVDLHGRVALVLASEPGTVGGDASSVRHVPLAERLRALRARGAAGVMVVASGPVLSPVTELEPASEGMWVMGLSRARAAWLQGTSETTLDPRTAPLPPRALASTTVSLVLETRRRTVTTANILGVVHGTATPPPVTDGGNGLPGGVLVVGAHYDHLGHGGDTSRAPGNRDVHNGADDNASGSAAVLELARRVVRHPLPRDVVFAWFGGEEEGMVGSRYLVAHRTPAVHTVSAMENFDMVGRLRHCRLYVEGTDTGRGLAEIATRANLPYGFDNRPWDLPTSWGASDHFSFRDARIPVVFFFTGLHPDYHTPADDADRIDYAGLAAVTDYGEAVLRSLGTSPAVVFTPR